MTGCDGRMARVAERLRRERRVAGAGGRAVAVALAMLLAAALGGLVAVAHDWTRADAVSTSSTLDVPADAGSPIAAVPDSLLAALDENESIVGSTISVRTVLEELVVGTDVVWVDVLPCSAERGYMLPDRARMVWCVGQVTGKVFVTDAGAYVPWVALEPVMRRDWLRIAYSIRDASDATSVNTREDTVMSSTATVRDVLTEFVVGPDVQWTKTPCADGRGALVPDSGPAGCVGTGGQPALTLDGADALWVDLVSADRAAWLAAGYELRELLLVSVGVSLPAAEPLSI